MKDVNDLMQAILEMDAAQRRESEKARLERSARLAALDEQKQKIIAECDAREKSESDAAARAAEEGNPPHWPRWRPSAARQPRP